MTREAFYEEITTAHKFMCSTKTTPSQWAQLQKRLGMLILVEDVPEDVRYMAEGALKESVMRRAFIDSRAPKSPEAP